MADDPAAVEGALLERLYGVAPEEFTAARNAVARELTQAGDRGAAAEVKALRKPTVVAWALNQVARARREDVEGLVAAGGELRRAQDRALGGDPRSLRDSRHAVDDRVRDLARSAIEVLQGGGRGPAGAEVQILNTLRAAALDDGVAARLLSGTLAQPADPPAFLAGAGESAAPTVGPRPPRDSGELREARRRLRQVEAELDRASRHVERLVEAAQRARRQADEAEAEARAAEEHLSTLRLDAGEAARTLAEVERARG